MKHILDIIKVMTPFPYTIDISSSLTEAKNMMEEHDITHLPVVSEGKLVGITTKRDSELAMALAAKSSPAAELRVGDICIRDPYIVEPSDSVLAVVTQMVKRQITSALVVKHGRLVGVFTGTNAFQLLIQHLLGKTTLSEPPDITA
jgi:acetoin utilization protein AcuB